MTWLSYQSSLRIDFFVFYKKMEIPDFTAIMIATFKKDFVKQSTSHYFLNVEIF